MVKVVLTSQSNIQSNIPLENEMMKEIISLNTITSNKTPDREPEKGQEK